MGWVFVPKLSIAATSTDKQLLQILWEIEENKWPLLKYFLSFINLDYAVMDHPDTGN